MIQNLLFLIGCLAIAVGIYVGILTAENLARMGVSPTNPIAATAWAGAGTFVVAGILIVAFGMVLLRLEQLKANSDRSVQLIENLAENLTRLLKRLAS
jgi:hypothetical protein